MTPHKGWITEKFSQFPEGHLESSSRVRRPWWCIGTAVWDMISALVFVCSMTIIELIFFYLQSLLGINGHTTGFTSEEEEKGAGDLLQHHLQEGASPRIVV